MVRKTASPLSLADAKSLIRSTGLRCTAARIAVLQCLAAAGGPLSPTEVADELAEFGFDKSTIYRSFTEFAEAGVVNRLDLGDSQRRFELMRKDDGSIVPGHPHFMCVECGEIQCLSNFTFELHPARRSDALPGDVDEVLLKGRCRDCL